MTLVSTQYHALSCNGRVDNIVSPVCGAKSPGAWRDAEAMEASAVELGWARHGKGHLCPACAATQEVKPEATEEPVKLPKRPRGPRGGAAPEPAQQDWHEDQAVGQ